MMGADVFTSQVLQRALELKEQGMSWSRISARLGVSDEGLRRRLVPGFAVRRQAMIREARYARSLGKGDDRPRHIPEAEALAVLRSVPNDNRDFTARLMGDPLPGRSALDKRRSSQVLHTIHSIHKQLDSGLAKGVAGFSEPHQRF